MRAGRAVVEWSSAEASTSCFVEPMRTLSRCTLGSWCLGDGWMSFWSTVPDAGLCVVLVFPVLGDLEPTDPVQGPKDTNHTIMPMAWPSPHLQGGDLKLSVPSPCRTSCVCAGGRIP